MNTPQNLPTPDLPNIDPNTPMGREWTDALYVPRMSVWNQVMTAALSCNIMQPHPAAQSTRIDLNPEQPPEYQPYVEPYRRWVQRAYLHLRDDGAYDYATNELTTTKAFGRWLKYPLRARHLHMNILMDPAKGILEGLLPPFMGLTAPKCHLLWDAMNGMVDCVPITYGKIQDFAGDPRPPKDPGFTVNVPGAGDDR